MVLSYITQVIGVEFTPIELYNYMLDNSLEFKQYVIERYIENYEYNSGYASFEEFHSYVRRLGAGENEGMYRQCLVPNPCLYTITYGPYAGSVCYSPAEGETKLCKGHLWSRNPQLTHSETAMQDAMLNRSKEFTAIIEDSLSALKNSPFPGTTFSIYRLTHDISKQEDFVVGLEVSRLTIEGSGEFARNAGSKVIAAMENVGCNMYLIYNECTCCD